MLNITSAMSLKACHETTISLLYESCRLEHDLYVFSVQYASMFIKQSSECAFPASQKPSSTEGMNATKILTARYLYLERLWSVTLG